LKELFEYSNDYSSFLTEIASDLSAEASTNALASFGGQADGSTALQSPCILDPDDPSITSCTDYLSSPTSWGEMDQFGEDYFLVNT